MECIEAACALVLNGGVDKPPQFALLRAAYESAGAATWLLAPRRCRYPAGTLDLATPRLVALRREGIQRNASRSRGAGGAAAVGNRRCSETSDQFKKRRPPGGFQKLISSIDDLPQHPQSLLTAWRLCSGVSHAKTWALREITTEVRSTQLYEHGHLIQVKPNRELFLTQLQVARRMVQRVGGSVSHQDDPPTTTRVVDEVGTARQRGKRSTRQGRMTALAATTRRAP